MASPAVHGARGQRPRAHAPPGKPRHWGSILVAAQPMPAKRLCRVRARAVACAWCASPASAAATRDQALPTFLRKRLSQAAAGAWTWIRRPRSPDRALRC